MYLLRCFLMLELPIKYCHYWRSRYEFTVTGISLSCSWSSHFWDMRFITILILYVQPMTWCSKLVQMCAVSMELEILGRHQHPNLTTSFLKVISASNFCVALHVLIVSFMLSDTGSSIIMHSLTWFIDSFSHINVLIILFFWTNLGALQVNCLLRLIIRLSLICHFYIYSCYP